MSDQLIIMIIVTIVIVAHLWLYNWVKFKMHEGIILKFLQDIEQNSVFNAGQIASTTDLKQQRVSFVCNKSEHIVNDDNNESWRLNKET